MPKLSRTPTDEAKKAIWTRILVAASHLKKREWSPTSGFCSVVQLCQASNEVPIYFIGYGVHEFNLAQSISSEQSIFAVEIPWPPEWLLMAAKDETKALPTVEKLVEPYVAAIRAHIRSTHCILAGHSFGGVMAFEASRQLARLNVQVNAIFLFNAAAIYPISCQIAWEKLQEIWRDRRGVGENNLPADSPITRIVNSLWIIRLLLVDKGRRLVNHLVSTIGPRPEQLTTKLDRTGKPIAWPRIKYIYDNAIKSYRLSRLDCYGVLFRARSAQKSASRTLEAHLGWDGLFAKGLDIVSVPGDHLSMMQKPHVKVLASEISKMLSKILPARAQGRSPYLQS